MVNHTVGRYFLNHRNTDREPTKKLLETSVAGSPSKSGCYTSGMQDRAPHFESVAQAVAWLTQEADRLELRAGTMARLASDYERYGLSFEAESARFTSRACRIDSIADRAFAATLVAR